MIFIRYFHLSSSSRQCIESNMQFIFYFWELRYAILDTYLHWKSRVEKVLVLPRGNECNSFCRLQRHCRRKSGGFLEGGIEREKTLRGFLYLDEIRSICVRPILLMANIFTRSRVIILVNEDLFLVFFFFILNRFMLYLYVYFFYLVHHVICLL